MALKVRTAVDGSGFAQGLNKMEEDAAKFGKTLSSKVAGNFNQAIMGVVPGLTSAIAGVFAADKIKGALTDFAARGKEIKLGALRLDVNPETFERIDNVMKAVGDDASTANTAFDKLAESMVKIERGDAESEKLLRAFADLGAASDDIAKKDVPGLFFKIASSLKGIEPSKEQIASLRTIFGRGGDNLLPAFQVGFDSNTATAGIVNDRNLTVINNYNKELREQKSLTAGIWNSTKAFGLAATSGLMFMLNPFRWAQQAGTRAADPHAAKILEEEQKRLAQIAAQHQTNQFLLEQEAKARAKSDKEDRAKAAAIDRETDALRERNKIAAMTPEEKWLELLKQIAQMQGELDYGGGDLTKAQEAELRRKIEEMRGQLGELDRSKVHQHLSSLGNQSIGGIMLGHDRFAEMNGHLRRAVIHLGNIDNKTPASAPRPRGFKQDFP